MNFNNGKFNRQFSEKNVFALELVHENIKLMNDNIGLILDNRRLRKRVKELESSRELSKDYLSRKEFKQVVILVSKDLSKFKS